MTKTEMEKIGEEIMRFMRGKYEADEIGNGKDTLRFKRGGRTILTIYIRDGRYDFHIILGKAEREKFERARGSFSTRVNDIYDNARTYHDGKWLLVSAANEDELDDIKALTLLKKKPNRKPFSRAHIKVGDCGHRCDLCVHYKGAISISAEQMQYARQCINTLYGGTSSWKPNCDGCSGDNCDSPDTDAACRKEKGHQKCSFCDKYSVCTKSAGLSPQVHTRTITADEVTWGILPYVKGQYNLRD